MANPSDKKSLIIISSVLFLIISSTYFISIFARGYQVDFKGTPSLKATGIISVTSKPKSASVYINDKLTTATDDTLNLPPGEYQVKIAKDGYLPWQKTFKVKKELVYQTDAQLYRSVPDLKPLTLSGAINPTVSPDGTKIIYAVASASASRDNGLYLIQLNDNLLLLKRNIPKQIAANTSNIDWAKFTFTFSPNSASVLAFNPVTDINYQLLLESTITPTKLIDITPKLISIQDEWANQSNQIITGKIGAIPPELKPLVSTDSAKNFSLSTTEDKILYLAKADGTLPDHIIPPPPAQRTQVQTRQIKKDNYYVYDLKDDTNFLLGSKNNIFEPYWLPNSDNVIYVDNDSIKVTDYDATNLQTLFAGDFDKNIVIPWTDGSRIVTFTTAYKGSQENLYTITIR
ncbi:MAG: PEGA domain-containing protein [Candidatus Shapirobacteria bacterium]|nr:PEGA domain-containing protein [Candidatus Shapirobacteria bacterium]